MDQDSQLPKNINGLMTRLRQKQDQDIAEQTALTSNALQRLDQNLQTQSNVVLHSTQSALVVATQTLEANVTTSLQEVRSNVIESLQGIATATGVGTKAMEDLMGQSQDHLKKTMIQQTNDLANQMRDTVQTPATDLAETVKQATKMLKLAKWIFWGALIFCLAVCYGIWLFWKAMVPWTLVEYANGQEYKVLEPGWSVTCKFEGKVLPPCLLVK
jgi:hypothetical protein